MAEGNADNIAKESRLSQKLIDQLTAKGVLKKNKAARLKSRLAKAAIKAAS